MKFLFAAALVACCVARGQSIIPPTRVPAAWLEFQPQTGEKVLECSVSAIPARLNYSFRFQTGYVARVPGRQYLGKGHRLAAFFRVTPENREREPVYLISTMRLPELPPNRVTLEVSGGFVVGEGKYRVDFALADDKGRVCFEKWTIKAKLGRRERDVPAGISPGSVDEISLRKWVRGSRGVAGNDGRRATILLNASPVMPRRISLGGYDRVLLLSSLASVVERLPVGNIRLIVFNLDQQREIFRDEDFEAADFGAVADALSKLQLGTVDYETLSNRGGHLDLLADLIRESNADASDAVLFLGPKPWNFDKMKRSLLPERAAGQPPYFYVQFRPRLVQASFPDTVTSAVKQLGGKTFEVYTPGDFAEAIRDIARALEEPRKPGSS